MIWRQKIQLKAKEDRNFAMLKIHRVSRKRNSSEDRLKAISREKKNNLAILFYTTLLILLKWIFPLIYSYLFLIIQVLNDKLAILIEANSFYHIMQSDLENALYNKFLLKNTENCQQHHDNYQQIKKSSDSLNMQLYLNPNEDQKSRSNKKFNHSSPHIDETHSFLSKNQDLCKTNLITKLQNFPFLSKKQNDTQNMLANHPKKTIKPSTPTCNAQSSLNFLKHRKNQIIMNQSQGLTFNNLQLIRKSKSKIHEDQRLNIKSAQQIQKRKTSYIQSLKYKFDIHVNSLISLKKQHIRSSSKKLERMNSASHQQITNSISGEFYPKENLPQEKLYQRKNRFINTFRNSYQKRLANSYEKGLANSFNSSTSQSIKSIKSIKSLNNSIQSDLPSARSSILKSISGKLTQSRMLRNIEADRQKRIKKRDRNQQSALWKRLSNLQHILSQLQIKPSQKNEPLIININNKTPFKNKFSVISHLRDEINLLSREISQLRERYSNISSNKFKRSQQERNPNLVVKLNGYSEHENSQLKIKREIQANVNQYPAQLKVNRNNSHLGSSFSKPSPIKICNNIRKQSPLRITFHYHSIQNPIQVPIISQNQNPYNNTPSFLQQSSNPQNQLDPSKKPNSFGYPYQNNLNYPIHKNIQANSSSNHRNSNNLHSSQTRINLPQSKFKQNDKINQNSSNLLNSHSQKKSVYFLNKQFFQAKRYSLVKTSTSNSINSPFIKPY